MFRIGLMAHKSSRFKTNIANGQNNLTKAISSPLLVMDAVTVNCPIVWIQQ